MTYPFWFSEDRWAARGLLLAVIALNLGIVYINVLLNKFYKKGCQEKKFSLDRRARRFCLEIQPTSL
jgi:hypothetical protein